MAVIDLKAAPQVKNNISNNVGRAPGHVPLAGDLRVGREDGSGLAEELLPGLAFVGDHGRERREAALEARGVPGARAPRGGARGVRAEHLARVDAGLPLRGGVVPDVVELAAHGHRRVRVVVRLEMETRGTVSNSNL